jgi:hypothetical protein
VDAISAPFSLAEQWVGVVRSVGFAWLSRALIYI